MAAIVANIVCEYLLNEASSGSSPTTVVDSVGSAPLSVADNGELVYFSGSRGRGLRFSGSVGHNSGAHTALSGKLPTSIGDVLTGSCTKVSVIASVSDVVGNGNGAPIVMIGKNVAFGELAVNVNSSGAIVINFDDDSSSRAYAVFGNSKVNSGAHLIHLVLDSSLGAPNGVKLYLNKVLQTPTTESYSASRTMNFNFDPQALVIGNHPDLAQGIVGDISYVAIVNGLMTSAERTASYDALALDDDTTLSDGGGGVDPPDPPVEGTYKKNVIYRFIDGAWEVYGNAYTDTGELTDTAKLGESANWDQVTGPGRPEDNATVGGAPNLLLDGFFNGVANDGFDLTTENWWLSDGNATAAHVDGTHRVRLKYGTTSAYIQSVKYIEASPNEVIYVSARVATLPASSQTSTNFIRLGVEWYDENKVSILVTDQFYDSKDDYENSNAWSLLSCALTAPDNAAFCRPFFQNTASSTYDMYLSSVYAGFAPRQLSAVETGTYIKNAAIDTLQLAGQAVVHPRYYTGGAVTTSNSWETACDCTFTPSAAGVPLAIFYTLNNGLTAYKTEGSRQARIVRNQTQVIWHDECYFVSGGGSFLQGNLSSFYIDAGHGGGSTDYQLQIYCENPSHNFPVSSSAMLFMELKR